MNQLKTVDSCPYAFLAFYVFIVLEAPFRSTANLETVLPFSTKYSVSSEALRWGSWETLYIYTYLLSAYKHICKFILEYVYENY
mmetsp:Transcript_7122/g.9303  ORF Transcript_7122/g.9303 Transcript_7122/m.9303 type:complete len:84 (+) Transcript_7122:1051-1302(+)